MVVISAKCISLIFLVVLTAEKKKTHITYFERKLSRNNVCNYDRLVALVVLTVVLVELIFN